MQKVSPLQRRKLPAADEMAFGIVVSERNGEITNILLERAVHTLREAGCPEHCIQIKYVPELFDLAMATQYFAEYTDVDAVLLLGCHLRGEENPIVLQGIMQSVTQIQVQWNMPCAWGIVDAEDRGEAFERSDSGSAAAAEAVRMVHIQIEMEAASPNAAPDRRNLN